MTPAQSVNTATALDRCADDLQDWARYLRNPAKYKEPKTRLNAVCLRIENAAVKIDKAQLAID